MVINGQKKGLTWPKMAKNGPEWPVCGEPAETKGLKTPPTGVLLKIAPVGTILISVGTIVGMSILTRHSESICQQEATHGLAKIQNTSCHPIFSPDRRSVERVSVPLSRNLFGLSKVQVFWGS